MIDTLAAVASFFDEDDWSYTKLQDPPMLRVACKGENGEWLCHVMCLEDPDALIVYSSCPFAIPEERRPAMSELLIRATWGLLLGTFEMDMDDGELRYRSGRALDASEMDKSMIRTVLYENVLALDRYLPAIKAVAWDNDEPLNALNRLGLD